MNCTYCGTRNSDGHHRCGRCGRRVHLDTAQSAPNPYPVSRAAVAPDLSARQSIPQHVVQAAVAEPRVNLPPRQTTLFPTQVLRFEDFAPAGRVEEKPQKKPRRATTRKPRATKRMKLEAAGQQTIDFMASAAPARPVTKSGVEPARYCENAVAMPVHRLLAATLDSAMVAIALGAFMAAFHALGGRIILNSVTVPLYSACAAGIFLFYKLLWWLADGDTPGMNWCRLRLLSFNGEKPSSAQRAQRFGGTCLSLGAAGLGLLWALGDEEKLGWNDHISKTFPSPVESKPEPEAD